MKNMILALGAALVGVCLFTALVTPAGAQAEGFTEAFDDPALPGWEHSSNAEVVDGVLRIGPDGYAFHPGPWTELKLELELRFTAEATVAIGYSASEEAEYRLEFEPSQAALFRIRQQLAQASLEPIPPGEWTRLTISVSAGRHEIRRNNQVILAASDPEPLPAGGLILRVTGAAGEFDNLVLTAEGAAPAAPTAALPQTTPAASALPTTAPAFGLPAYQAGSWVRLNGPPGGLGYDIRMQPDNPDIMYVTDGFTGLFKSTDGGQSWFPINKGIETSPGIGAKAFSVTIDPHDYNTVWMGLQLSGHIYRSTNAGQTWEQRDNGLLFEDCSRSVRGITVDPNDQDTVYAGLEVDNDCWSDVPLIRRLGLTRGEVYRTTDAGQHWTRVWVGENLARYIWVDPRDSDRLYVSTGLFDRDAANSDIPNGVWGGVGILRSEDGGRTWTVLDQDNGLEGLYVPSLFMHPQDPDTLVAAVTFPFDSGAGGVYVTHDGGNTWRRVLTRDGALGIDAVEISPSDPDIWYAASENVIYRSEDAGRTWVGPMRMATADRNGGMPIDLQVDPRDPYRIFENAYGGGNMVSTDGGATWSDASRGYCGSRADTLMIIPGSQGWSVLANGFRSDDGGDTWRGTGIDMRGLALSTGPVGPTIVAYELEGAVHVSSDAGETWESGFVADTQGQPWNAALAVAPAQPRVIYLGHYHYQCLSSMGGGGLVFCLWPMPGLFRSVDGGRTWRQAGAPFGDVSVLDLAVHPQDPAKALAATAKGLYRTSDVGDTWEAVSSFNSAAWAVPVTGDPSLTRAGLEAPVVRGVAYDPFNPQVIYAGNQPGALLRSMDGGMTWEQSAAGMDPNEPVTDILPDPNRQGVVYAGSLFSGVFVSTDSGLTWRAVVDGLERKDVVALALSEDGTVLYAGTASGSGGAGVWRLGTPPGQPPSLAGTPAASPSAPSSTSAAEATPTFNPMYPDGRRWEGVPFVPCPTASIGPVILALGLLWVGRRK